MPSLQLDLPVTLSAADKATLARRLGVIYARVMQVRPELVSVVVRDHGPHSVWRCTDADPVPSALVMCDVRRGRDRATRAELAGELIATCADVTALSPDEVKIEFTQHDGDEMFHPRLGGFNTDWTGDERDRPHAR